MTTDTVPSMSYDRLLKTVYILNDWSSVTRKKYHAKQSCAVNRSRHIVGPVEYKDALLLGYTPCGICSKGYPDRVELEINTGPILGWKILSLSGGWYAKKENQGNHYLMSPFNSTKWEGRELTAKCNSSEKRAETHLSTGKCTCGLYSYKLSELKYWLTGPSDFAAYVGLSFSGVVYEYDIGYRAQHARIDWVLFPISSENSTLTKEDVSFRKEGLSKNYGVPVLTSMAEFQDFKTKGLFNVSDR